MSTTQVTTPPPDHNTVNPFVIVPRAADFITFVTEVFDARESRDFRIPDRDGLLIHAEVVIGNSSILICDSKSDWPFTPALLQVYVADSGATLDRAVERGSTIVTPVSTFYGGYTLARFRDPWSNLWWLYTREPDEAAATTATSDTDWRASGPSLVYSTIVEAMRTLHAPE